MSQDFKSQLQALVNQAAEKYAQSVHSGERYVDYHNSMPETIGHFKACSDLLIPVLMRAIEQRNTEIDCVQCGNDSGIKHDVEKYNKDLLNILKVEGK